MDGARDRYLFRRWFLVPLLFPPTDFCNLEVFATKLNIPGDSSEDDKKRGKKATNLFSPYSAALPRAKEIQRLLWSGISTDP